MAVPKSVTKINKKGVTYVSSVDKANYYIYELSRAALRDVGKFVKRTFKDKYYSVFKKNTGNAGRATSAKVYSSKTTKYPRIQIGLKQQSKGFYSYFQEMGSSKTPKLGLLQKSVYENVAQIVSIESQYLSALEDEARALSLINEEEYEVEGDE